MNIPLAKPYTDEREVEAVVEVVRSGWLSQGPKVIEFEQAVASYVGARFGIAVNSATSALHLACVLQGLGPGDEVICPSFTCVATANAIRHAGATPVFVDIDPLTYNLDPKEVAGAITPKTKGIMVVHQIGLAADMDPILQIARIHSLVIIEDAACALGAEYKGRRVGSLSDLSCFSFHPRKVVATGEGGMITTSNPEFAERARVLRAHGASPSDLVRHAACGTIYATYPEVGWNYRLTDLQAAVGVEQMKKIDQLLKHRQFIASFYDERLAEIPEVATPRVPTYGTHSWQSYLIKLLPGVIDRDKLLLGMAKLGISCRHGIAPCHQESCYKKEYKHIFLPETEKASRSTMFLPIYPAMAGTEMQYVVDSLKALLK